MTDAHGTWEPLAPELLVERLAEWLASTDAGGVVRLAIDGPACADPQQLAEALVEPLRARGRPVAHIESATFWRDASLRLEYGHEDAESYSSWLDHGALQREVLSAAADRGEYLPSLRDPASNRSTRHPPVAAPAGTVLIVSGPLLFGLGLSFERTVHLAVSPGARGRRTPPDDAWTLPALDEYDETVRPVELADVVVRYDDPDHPAVRGLHPDKSGYGR